MIKISLNKELDYEVYQDFNNFFVAGADFGGGIKKDHPGISLENYKKYIDDFYIANQDEMTENLDLVNNLISEKQDKFYSALKDIFHMDFNADPYQGYLSIFNCNPRWPETKTFQIFYKKDLSHMLEVACHESLHFAFFDYLDKNFTSQINGLSKNSGVLWELSEILNVIILNLPPFNEILGMEELLFYPELQPKLDKAKEIWNECGGNIKELINMYLEDIK
jgi:hypothetical protein